MTDRTPEIGVAAAGRARQAQRAHRSEQRRRAQAEALAALHAARADFQNHADDLYRGGREAAGRDGDDLELLAGRLVDWVQALEPAVARLEVAGDQAVYRGPVLTCLRAPFAPAVVASCIAEALGETLLSAHAQAVLVAAVKYAAA